MAFGDASITNVELKNNVLSVLALLKIGKEHRTVTEFEFLNGCDLRGKRRCRGSHTAVTTLATQVRFLSMVCKQPATAGIYS